MFSKKIKKIFILVGHPDIDSFNCTLASEYEKGALEAGHEVRRVSISHMKFDPILHSGYRLMQDLEPDLVSFQENVRWCDHFVVLYPSWWSTMPALLKGLFDRVWLPGFAYKFTSNISWQRLLKGRSATMIVTSDTIPLAQRIIFGDTTNELKRGILWFAGFSPIRVHKFGYLKHFGGTWRRERLKRKVYNLGRQAK
ncbi:MAG: NADPH:quinone reductase [Candidatus Zambryskibacteria bacterium CG11_big_fil_rev_8_21_14_0_20_42_18]|uniref:NADPH:quinone reductase n=1 Tax=Candidatus Zambryskibacteria bacterium CG_4_9_14_3_um_filter_42_15 TaxID=1975112 RepID=A0A2M7WTH5_9BACT|nr:MAG: NADPH:quinone reductase [Candidatus Zambryskibacteria bacterium CG11_big_fil_rev_8_21_14_0_20_42_18]PJA33196.1 MAG: NADPH:quinone reductase [Candidatus Zambryskibacteria bacterium CG_4_9_14_3_um_filter_42_15]